nr:hypothetical protein [Tanacetum cinerariifolium]
KEEEKKAEEVKVIAGDAQVEGRQAEIQAEIYQIDMNHPLKVLKVVAAASAPVNAASTIIPATEPNILAATITTAPVKVTATSTRRRRGVVIRDPEEESSAKTFDETKSKDKGKGIMVEEPKPMKKKQQVEMDEAYARKLHKELNQDIDWDVAIEHVKQKAKEDPFMRRYQVMKKRPQTEAQARRNMITYLKNTAGFRLDYFKGMPYDDIHLIFEAKFNANIEFLLKLKEQIKEEENRALESINKTLAQKASKRRRLNQEDKDVEEIKQHLEIVPDEEDDVYTEATPFARKVPVVGYQIIHLNNKPRYKIIRADGTHQLFGVDASMDHKENTKCLMLLAVGDDQVKGRQAEIYQIDMDHASKVLSMQEDEPEVQEVVDVVTTTKLITEVVTAASESLTAASITIATAEPDPEEESTAIILADTSPRIREKELKHQVFNAAGEELSAAKQKLMQLG